MKNLIAIFSFTCILSTSHFICAQKSTLDSNILSENYMDRNPIYDYDKLNLNTIDSIPDFELKQNKLKITGTIYESDGVTPAKDVILFIEQADENGDFDLRKHRKKRYVHHRGWIKTDSEGQYTFYTFVPGNDRRFNQLQQLFPVIKESSKPEYEIASFLFDEDPLLTKRCRKRIIKKGDPSRILKLKKEGKFFVVRKDIVLSDSILTLK